jgi:hypothetical protein
MTGDGPIAELLRRRFDTACRRIGLNEGHAMGFRLDTRQFAVPKDAIAERNGGQMDLF